MIASPATLSPGKAMANGPSLSAKIAPGSPRPASDMIASLGDGLVGYDLKANELAANGASNFALAAMDILAAQTDTSLALPEAAILDADLAAQTETPAQTPIRPPLLDTRAALSLSIDPELPNEADPAPVSSSIDEQSGDRDAQRPVSPIAPMPSSQSQRLDPTVDTPAAYAGVSPKAATPPNAEMADQKEPQTPKPKPELIANWPADAGKSVPTGKDLPEIIDKQEQANLDRKTVFDRLPSQSSEAKSASLSAPVGLISDVSLPLTRLDNEQPSGEVRQTITEAGQAQAVRTEAVFRAVAPPVQTDSASAIAVEKTAQEPSGVSLRPLAPVNPDTERAAPIASAKIQSRPDGQTTLPGKYEVARAPVKGASLPVEQASDDLARLRPEVSFSRAAAADISKADNAAMDSVNTKLAPQSAHLANQYNSNAPVQNSSAAIISAPNVSVSSNSAQPTVTERPIAPQLDQTIDQLTQAREASRTARSELTVRHAEFGAINMRLESAAGGDLRAILANRDPGFVPAIQAALADRAIAAASETSTSANNQSSSRQSENGSNSAHTNNQNGGGWGSNSGSEGHYGSSLGGERSTSQPSLEQLESERQSDLSRDEDATGTPNHQGMRDNGLFA